MNSKTLTFTKELPNCEGQFLIKWKSRDGFYEVITVYFRPKNIQFGVEWEAGLFISTWNNAHVSKINLDMVEGIAKL